MNKKILSSALAVMMLVAPANAAGGEVISTNNGNGDVPVHLTQDATQFSVTVPTVLPVDVNTEGIVTVANDNKIINHSFGPVEVKSVSVQSLGDWKLVDFDTDFKSKKVGLHEYGFQMNNTNVQPDGSCAAEFEVIPGNGQISFVYDSKVATQNTALDKENIANVVFTVGWKEKRKEVITFTINKQSVDMIVLNAEAGMTWEQWVKSDYNTVKGYIGPDYGKGMFMKLRPDITNDPFVLYHRNSNKKCISDELIIADENYSYSYSPDEQPW